jgi:hypothetical protein
MLVEHVQKRLNSELSFKFPPFPSRIAWLPSSGQGKAASSNVVKHFNIPESWVAKPTGGNGVLSA